MAQNRIEKIVQTFAVDQQEPVHSADFVTIRPAYVMTHDNTAAVIPKFKTLNRPIHDPTQIVFTLDHNIQDKSEKNLAKYAAIEAFAREKNIDFYPAGRGIGHQVMCEEGHAWPDTFVVASDSHSNMYGGLGCLGTPIVRSDAAAAWATGSIWWEIPPVTKITLSGKLRPGVTGKDLIITLAGFFNKDEILNHALEIDGEGVAGLSVDQRLTIANMSTEWGALAALFPVDDLTLQWLETRHKLAALRDDSSALKRLNPERIKALSAETIRADFDAMYAAEIEIDLGTVTPHISGPNSVKTIIPLAHISEKQIPIQKAYLLSCVNARLEDLAEAAQVVRGQKVHPQVKFYIAAASSEVQRESERRGDWQTLLEAGAIELPPGCGPCIGLGAGTLESGETGISATNRNFKGRMGARDAKAYLASPAVVAASAIRGYIASPEQIELRQLRAAISRNKQETTPRTAKIIAGFPQETEGRVWFLNADNINTDLLYPSQYTYREDLSEQEIRAVVLQDFDPELAARIKTDDIIVAGYNFGTGSSREQAATALKMAGVRMVIAASFSATYKRNAFNNGFLVMECTSLLRELRNAGLEKEAAHLLPASLVVKFSAGVIEYGGKQFTFTPPGTAGQRLILDGGLIQSAKIK